MSLSTERVERSTPGEGSTARVTSHRGERVRLIAGLASLVLGSALGSLALIAIIVGLAPGWQGVSITSGSMRPALVEGDLVLISVAPDLVDEGRIVTFVDPTTAHLTTHRVASVNADDTITTQGDANTIEDPISVRVEDVVGAARFVVPWVGLPAYWLATGQWLLLAAAVAFVIMLGVGMRAAFEDAGSGPIVIRSPTSDIRR